VGGKNAEHNVNLAFEAL